MDILNVRVWDWDGPTSEGKDEATWMKLRRVWCSTKCRVKVNCSVGVVLERKATGELRYFHSSSNNATVFASPRLISTESELKELHEDFAQVDLREQASTRTPLGS